MDIIGCDPGVTEQEVAKYGIHLLPQEKVLQDSDFLSLHAPLNRYTKHMINRETLSQMKPGAILINTARGPLVDEQALREAVLSGHLAGAALDVLNEEPVRPDAPLLGQEQIIPHTPLRMVFGNGHAYLAEKCCRRGSSGSKGGTPFPSSEP